MPIVNRDTDTDTDLEVDYDKNVTNLYESISDSDWDIAIADMQNNPSEARTWVVRHHDDGHIMWRFLPIHSACARQPPEIVVNSLISTYRYGAQCLDDQGMLPLHYACGNQASVDVIRLLLLAYPDGAKITDPNGMVPLHYIAQWGPNSIEAIDVLLFANRNALSVRDKDGNTPIDLAQDGEYDENERDRVIQALERFTLPSSSRSYAQTSGRGPTANNNTMNVSREAKKHAILTSREANNNTMDASKEEFDSQQTDLRGFTSMPSTSDAVRRLQQAAAAQQSARESFLKGADSITDERDDYGPSGLRNAPSYDDVGTVYTMDTGSQRIVSSLKEEVEKLRNEAKLADVEARKQIQAERKEMQKAISEMKAKLADCEQETSESLSELSAKEAVGQQAESCLKVREADLESSMKRNEQLRNDLDSMKMSISKYREKSMKLDDHLSALTRSMKGMMDEQEQIVKASAKHEEHMKKVSMERQKKMQELIDQEVAFARMSLEKQKQRELGSEEMINAALESQKKLMSSIAGVLTPDATIEV